MASDGLKGNRFYTPNPVGVTGVPYKWHGTSYPVVHDNPGLTECSEAMRWSDVAEGAFITTAFTAAWSFAGMSCTLKPFDFYVF